MTDPATIPGMIEPVEQELLTRLAAEVAGRGAIVEFGCFLGRSTVCLLNGARTWWSAERGQPAVFAYDSFECREGGAFAPHVLSGAKRGGVEHLVQRNAGRMSFLPVFQHFVGDAERIGLLKTLPVELEAAQPDGDQPIALMHIDAPKFYRELKYVLFRFLPRAAPGGAIVFQDYLYHWSATMIAGVQLLREAGLITYEASRASALLTRVVRPPTAEDLLVLDLAMTTTSTADLIDRAILSLQGVAIDRAAQFIPRLQLAKVQWLWEVGDYPAAQAAFLGMLRTVGHSLSGPVLADYCELLRNGYSIRRAYDLDHPA